MPIILKNINKSFSKKSHVLRSCSLKIEEGRFCCIVGPSGCGKTTLLKLIAGLISADSGSFSCSIPPEEIATVFQEDRLLPWRTCLENIRLALELNKSKAVEQENIDSILKLVGLEKYAHFYPHELSGGMKMRVALARALVTKPRLLLLDEPFAALDEDLRYFLAEELLQIWLKHPITCVFVTHSLSDALFLGQEVLIMETERSGKIKSYQNDWPYPRTSELRYQHDFTNKIQKLRTELPKRRSL